jgi:hypothetical protein
VSNVLEVFLSSTNFVIYCVFRKQFRYILRHRLCRSDDDIRTQRSRAVSLALASGGMPATLFELTSTSRADDRNKPPMSGQRNGRSSECSDMPLLETGGGGTENGKRKAMISIKNQILCKVNDSHSSRCNNF